MTQNIPAYAPGCYGSAIAFQEGELTCKACSFCALCRPVAEYNADLLRAKFNLGAPARRTTPAPAPVEEVPQRPDFRISQRVQKIIDQLDQGSYDIAGNLQRGENPFDNGLPLLRVACHLLLRLGRPLSRETLAMAYVSHLKLKQETADVYARAVFFALNHVGAVVSNDGLISIRESAHA